LDFFSPKRGFLFELSIVNRNRVFYQKLKNLGITSTFAIPESY
jgi:hypothetical protein